MKYVTISHNFLTSHLSIILRLRYIFISLSSPLDLIMLGKGYCDVHIRIAIDVVLLAYELVRSVLEITKTENHCLYNKCIYIFFM